MRRPTPSPRSALALCLALAGLALALLVPAASGKGGGGAGPEPAPADQPAPTAPVKRTTAIGISDETAAMFQNPTFQGLGAGAVRVTVPIDYRKRKHSRERIESWLAGAKAGRYDIFVTFTRANARGKPPTPRAYGSFVRSFVRAHPYVRRYSPWNEQNLCTQLLCRDPKLAAAYYRQLAQACRTCTIVAAELVVAPPLPGRLIEAGAYGRMMMRYGVRPRVWGFHNYTDANRLQTTWTRKAARVLPGEIWYSETGGMVHRPPYRGAKPPGYRYPASVSHQAKAIRYLFGPLARVTSRVKRIYVYQWFAGPPRGWDSGLVDSKLRPRPALATVRRAIAARTR
ncbi:MAG: hypothetical protein U0T02_01830 [Solirubrobacteraceae bacterium]